MLGPAFLISQNFSKAQALLPPVVASGCAALKRACRVYSTGTSDKGLMQDPEYLR